MSEMVERVASAYEAERKLWTQNFSTVGDGIQVEIWRDGRAVGSSWSFQAFEASGWRVWQSLRDNASARAAIAAMREPTPEMTAKGFEAIFGSGCDKLAADCYRHMIDAALSE